MPNSYMISVKTKKEKNWVRNGLRFGVVEHAHEYATDLIRRWGDVTATHVEMSDDPANATYPVPSDRYPVQRTRTYKERGPVLPELQEK